MQKVTRLLQNKRNADYVKSLANNVAPRQVYLYQRYIEEAIERTTPGKTRESISQPDFDSQTANLIKQVQMESSNLDIEFTEIGEGDTTDEVSPSHEKRRHTTNALQPGTNAALKRAILALHKHQSVQLPAAKAGSKTAALSGNGESKAEEKDSERCIKGIPVRTFIDEIKRQDRARREADGSLEEFPIVIPGIGLHAIKQKHAAKEQKALGGKAKNPKFEYQRAIMEHFLRDERRLVEREKQIFEQMEDALDDERTRKKVD